MSSSPTTWHQVAIALVSGGIAGTIVSAVVSPLITAQHERTERRKARRIDAADAFIQAFIRHRLHLFDSVSFAETAQWDLIEKDGRPASEVAQEIRDRLKTASPQIDERFGEVHDRLIRLAIVFPKKTRVYEAAKGMQDSFGKWSIGVASTVDFRANALDDYLRTGDESTLRRELALKQSAEVDAWKHDSAVAEELFLERAERACR